MGFKKDFLKFDEKGHFEEQRNKERQTNHKEQQIDKINFNKFDELDFQTNTPDINNGLGNEGNTGNKQGQNNPNDIDFLNI